MNLKLKKLIKLIMVWSSLLLFVIVIWDPSIAIGRGGPKLVNSYDVKNRKANMSRILSVLENKMGDQKLLEKAKDKLVTLNDRQIKLIASLSDRVANEGNTAGADIALLLISASIALF